MACTACNEFGEPNGMFVTGCTSYKVDSLTKHEKPKQHEKCALVTEAKLKSREESSAAKIIQTLNKDIFMGTRQLGPRTSRPISEDKSTRMLRQLGPSIIIVVLLIFLIKLTEIIKIQSDICQQYWEM